ncbi:hypothetical protein [Methylobacterium aquaticum]|uniref:hypothetical protein n=1 Tax=Methylobacterium aquaticum TaxID=270351 RepID=UPI001931C24B|nr:hypothetical protein [Methylobacterium aquaticum]QRE76486.1 hypothetical protein F1D61_25555 [Methylobacterium aquaticum]
MTQNWWEAAPLASTVPPAKGWWEDAPLATADQRAGRMAPTSAPDPIRTQVRGEIDAQRAAGLERRAGTARQWLQGASLGTADEVLAGLMTPVEMVKRGTLDPREGYAYAKAREDLELEDGRRDNGGLGTAMELAGNVGAGAGLAKAGVTAIPAAQARLGSLGGAAAGGAIDGLALGAVSGAAEGDGVGRLAEAGKGAAVGAALGGALPLAGAALGTVAGPILSNITARVDPAGYAERQVGRAAARSGQTPEQIADRIGQAAADGQGEYRLLDALGYDGARLGAVVSKNPGQGRTDLREFLNDRQGGQARRIGEAVTEAFEAPQTARGQTGDLYSWARDASEPFYEKALSQAPVWSDRLNEFLKDPITKQGIRRGIEIQRLESLAAGKKFDPFDIVERFDELGEPVLLQVPNMRTVNVIKKGIDDILEQYRDKVTGRLVLDEKGRAIDQVRRAFLNEVDNLNPDFAKARAMYAGPMEIKDAVAMGRQAGAGRARAADNIAQFEGMSEPAKQGFRVGYADPVLGRVERAAEGVNKARQFGSDAAQAELQAFTRPDKVEALTRQLGRENEMFANRAEALGNSKTAENLADNADVGVDAGLLAKLLAGNFGGAMRDTLARGAASLNGNTEAVRQNLARLLMEGRRNEALTLLLRLGQQEAGRTQRGAQIGRGIISAAVPAVARAQADDRSRDRR